MLILAYLVLFELVVVIAEVELVQVELGRLPEGPFEGAQTMRGFPMGGFAGGFAVEGTETMRGFAVGAGGGFAVGAGGGGGNTPCRNICTGAQHLKI